MKDKKLGIVYIIMSAFFFALMNLFVRLSGDLPVMQKSFFRNLVALVIAAIMLKKSGQPFKIGRKNMPYMLVRAAAGTFGILCNFYAIGHMNLADASILNKLSPFFAVIFSIFLLKERVRLAEWGILALAFAGTVLVMKPSFTPEFFYAVAGFTGGMCAGLAYACVRKLGANGVNGAVTVMFFSGFSCVSVLPAILLNYAPMSPEQLVFLLLAGCSAAGGQFAITAAYTKAPAREISVFDYTHIIFTSVLGLVVFGQIPDILSLLGYIIIISAAVVKWRYNMRETGKSQ